MRYWALYYVSTGELAWTGASDYRNDVINEFSVKTRRGWNEVKAVEITKEKFDKLNSD